jgi:hypothetical protein
VNDIETAGAAGTLTAAEKTTLAKLEQVIEHGLGHVWRVARALRDIRDARLYREKYKTFEAYCEQRWQFSRMRAHQLIESAKVVSDLADENVNQGLHTEIGQVGNPTPAPTTERQVRPLLKLPKEERKAAWQEASATAPKGKVTAKHVERVVAKKLAEANQDSETASEQPPVPTDELGIPLSEKMALVFAVNEKFQEAASLLRRAAKVMDEITRMPGGEHLRHELSAKISGEKTIFRSIHLDNARRQVEQSKPYSATCAYCHHAHPGKFDQKCKGCYGLGWNTRREWDQTPEDYRQAALAAAKQGGGK